MGFIDRARSLLTGGDRTRDADIGIQRSMRRRLGPARRGVYDLTDGHQLVPQYPEYGPHDITNEQRIHQTIARALYLNNSWVRNLVRYLKDTYVDTGPIPRSRFPERDELWLRSSKKFDNRGVHSFGAWLREDVYRNEILDGEVFIRRRSRYQTLRNGVKIPERGLLVPIQFQALTSEFVPMDDHIVFNGSPQRIAGITFDARERPVSYRMHKNHPRSMFSMGDPVNLVDVPADEVYHLFSPLTGSPRGDVPIAAALLRAIKVSTLDDSELRRKLTANLTSLIIETAFDTTQDDTYLPDEDTIGQMINDIDLVPGGIIRVPAGHKAKFDTPPDEGTNFEKAFRFQLLQICAAVGAPPHEIIGDHGQMTERMAKYVGLGIQRQARIKRDQLEHQVLDPMHADWVDAAMDTGIWMPPPNARPEEIYDVEWQWPIIPQASLTQELNILMQAEEKGHLPHGYISQNYFGMSEEVVARSGAKAFARAQELGHTYANELWAPATETAKRIQQEAAGEEARERDTVEASLLEDSPVIDGKKKTSNPPRKPSKRPSKSPV